MLPTTRTETHVLIPICTPESAYPRFYDAILSTKYFDDESELAYYGYRYYSPEMGRWISRDPLGVRSGLNLYGFGLNSTPNIIDFLGAYDLDFAGSWTRVQRSTVELDFVDLRAELVIIVNSLRQASQDSQFLQQCPASVRNAAARHLNRITRISGEIISGIDGNEVLELKVIDDGRPLAGIGQYSRWFDRVEFNRNPANSYFSLQTRSRLQTLFHELYHREAPASSDYTSIFSLNNHDVDDMFDTRYTWNRFIRGLYARLLSTAASVEVGAITESEKRCCSEDVAETYPRDW